MAENKNMKVSDETMTNATGGTGEKAQKRAQGVVKCTWKTDFYLVTITDTDGIVKDVVASPGPFDKLPIGLKVEIELNTHNSNWHVIRKLS